jgi:hypothetical protein
MGAVTRLFGIVLLLAIAPCLGFGQAFAVHAPFDPNSYRPLDGQQRWHRWLMEDGGSPAIHVQSFAAASYLQFIGDPDPWGRTTRGFARRTASSYGGNLIENTVHESLAAAEGTDPRYFACACTGFFRRSGHALKMTFLTYTHGGHETLDIPQLAGVYGSSMIESMWWPRHYTAVVQGVQNGHIQVGLVGGMHLIQEFSPELKRMFHLRFGEDRIAAR